MVETAKRVAVGTLVAIAILAAALALWKLKLVLALLFLAFILAAAMRPGVDALARRRVPRSIGIGVHYVAFLALLAGLIWLVVPRALDQVDAAISSLPETRSQIGEEAGRSTGLKHDVLLGIQRRLQDLPSGRELTDPAVDLTVTVVEVGVGIFFTLASAAYWIYERDRTVGLVCSLLPSGKARTVRDTWTLIDLKLGAFVRGQGLLVVAVGTVLSLAFWAIGLPYWLLIGVFAGLVEVVPVVGPLLAGALAVGIGLTVSWQVALAAGLAVLVVRLLEDYVVIPRVLGDAVGLTPLAVLVAVATVGILFGGFAVFLAIPLAAVVATLVDVLVRGRDPAREEVPTVLFSATDVEAGARS
jgi:predicted PurR-regulated permease PerM